MNAERLFYEEVREKKRAGRGAFAMRGKGKKHGTRVKTSYDYLSNKEKKKLNGAVFVTNIFTSLMDLKELQQHPEERQKLILEKWRETYKVPEIQKALGISKADYYELLYSLEVLERPASANKPPQPEKYNRRDKEVATAENLISWADYMSRDRLARLDVLEDYTKRFNMHTVAEVWGVPVSKLYNQRYQYNKVREREQGIEQPQPQPEPEPGKEPQEQIELAELQPEPEPVKYIAIEPDEPEEDDQPQEPQQDPEIEELKAIVAQQGKLLSEFLEFQKKIEVEKAAGAMKPAEPDPEPQPQETGFNIRYEDEKQGFLIAADVSSLLAMLQKNPDTFKAEIIIKKIEA